MQLSQFSNQDFNRGAPVLLEIIWLATQGFLFSTWLPGAKWRCWLLRIFGANIGKGVNIKPRAHVKFPWRLSIGNYSWIGEGVWIDNLNEVKIGNNVCVSQGSYICTGSHDYKNEHFRLITKPIIVEDG